MGIDAEVNERAPEGMAGLIKGLSIIEAFNRNTPQMTVADAARAANCSRAAARRCLLSLADQGYLAHDGKNFRPTPRMLRLADSYLEAAPLPQIAYPFLAQARDMLNESTSIAVLDGHSALVVARAEANQIVLTGARVGTRMPLHCTAVGRVLLAGMQDEQLDHYFSESSLEARTPQTPTSQDAIRKIIDETRMAGFAQNDEELDRGMLSIAVPVTEGKGGSLIAAFGVSSFTARISLERMVDEFVPVLKAEAHRLSQSL